MSAVDPIVRFENIQKSYDGEVNIVKNLNLDIERGEFLTLLGPSGSGKSTCLMMLAGFESPTQGTIYLDGQALNKIPPYKRDIGVVFQNYALFPHMSVAENIAFPLGVRKVPKSEIEQRTKKALDMVRLGHLADRKPIQLSGGQQQRIALARALVFEPKLVLLDEPLGALDKNLREQMQIELKHLHENLGVTMVFVTHDQSEALTMSDRIAVFNDGIIQQIDSPTALYERPANEFVATFIGETNVMRGTVEQLINNTCQLRLNSGALIHAEAGAGLQIGQPACLSVRPERIDFTLASDAECNRINGHLAEYIYHGDHIRLRLTLAENDDFMIKVPANHWQGSFTPGQATELCFRASDCRAVPVA
ncbi:putative spermidine/putrescine transport system ATP-binding protein [Oceanospirillum multiglobuliferum]|uniref:Spermidine/putrescine import ATP-binding protein PotA n=1 Tax=Oceanospirillum multiglobuliferum TaxID=64969 RepID=A0A1T4QAL5_9GAMM|nr:ABC transporter ATP-binding protein [Oceanospirillum multiglobuliferum]OPX56553.1 spermidine/putrescine ABC transporter ATP-binding protein [Oceanospirillum multiglobuliferum]SKA00666.1 putative spermidine/putrescine transport system ATP-binding protein [Oceanospirillum multiglobuliferum]